MLTSSCREIMRWVSILACLLCFSSMGEGQQKCPTRVDERFHGMVVDCTSKGLNSSDIPNLDIPINNTTSLILDYNNLEHVINGSFSRLQKLCRLQIDYSGITHIDADAFSGLAALQVLSLYGNSLDIVDDALPPGVFKHTLSLKELNIGNNTIKSAFGNYANFIDSIDFLPELYYLYITSFPILHIGKEFERLHTLKSLDVYGTYQSTILNNSLEGLENSNITHFKLAFANPFDFETGVFKNLPDTISSLTLFKVSAGNINLLKALEHLENRTIPVLYFDGVSLPFTENPRRQIDDGIIEEQNLKYLLNICVYNLTWKNSDVMALDLGFIPTSYFGSCIKSIDISGNRLQLYRPTFFPRLASLSHLEEVRLSQDGLSKHTVSFWDDKIKDLLKTIPQDINQEHEFVDDSHYMSLTTESKRNNSSPDLSSPSNPRNDRYEDKSSDYMRQETQLHLQESTLKNANLLPSNPNNVLFANATKASSFGNSTQIIYLPHNLRYASLDTLLGFRNINSDYLKFHNPNNGTELYLRYTKSPIVLRCLYLGLHNLRLIDLTGTLLHYIPLSLFDYFPSLQVLVLRQTQEDPGFFQKNGRRLIKNIAKLVYLDLSDNGLSVLPEGIFQENRQLRYLCLAKNRFSTIPFQIQLTPSLEMLDLRMNAFSGLDKEEKVNIDKHITSHERKNFTVFMAGNNLQCVCSDISFAAWMQRTHAQFDPKVGRTCLGEDGKKVTIELFSDVEQMWRKCQGQYFLLLSLLFFFAMLVLYLAVFLMSMYQTYIIGKLKQMFVPEFQRQTRQDFSYDVFIGYAEQECAFVRFHLLRYLEGHLKLKAFVHQRDLRQDLLDLGTALKDSWRTLLVITEAFLAHDMCECIMKTATFFESPSKQDSIVVMVTQDLQYAIPDYVLRVVKDENIIVLPDLVTPFSYEATETLRTRILY